MYSLNTLTTSVLALSSLTPIVFASPLDQLEERAAATCQYYAATQISACPTGTAFCSSFLATFPPVATSTTTTTTTSTSTTDTVTVTSVTATATVTANARFDCTVAQARAKRTAAAAPAPYGPRCNVNAIEGTKVENACLKCLPGFKYNKKRPNPTTTTTVTSTSTVVVSTASTATNSIVATHTALAFKMFQSSATDPAGRVGDPWGVVNDEISTETSSFSGQGQFRFFQDSMNNNSWATHTLQNGDLFFPLFGQQTSSISRVHINLGAPNTPPTPDSSSADPSAPYVPLQISFGFDRDRNCPVANINYPDGTPAFLAMCDDQALGELLYISTTNPPSSCTSIGAVADAP